MKRPFCTAVVTLFLCGLAQGAGITAIGGWLQMLNTSFLLAGAGSNLQSSVVSIAGSTVIDLSGAGGSWTVRARLSPGLWDSNVTLQVRRASDGIGLGSSSIVGGESFIDVTTTDTLFFTGKGNRTGVALQYRLTGLSCQVPPGTYTAPVIFTVE
jgi:hypothetical protein